MSDVRKIKCNIANDGSYECDITSGTYTSWFARCIGDRLKGMTGRMGRGSRPMMAELRHRFAYAARDCRGQKHKYSDVKVNIEGVSLDAPTTERYFLKEFNLGRVKSIKQGNKKISVSYGKGITCVFDDDTDSLACDRIKGVN